LAGVGYALRVGSLELSIGHWENEKWKRGSEYWELGT